MEVLRIFIGSGDFEDEREKEGGNNQQSSFNPQPS
jgi:hypothetical protein